MKKAKLRDKLIRKVLTKKLDALTLVDMYLELKEENEKLKDEMFYLKNYNRGD